MAPLPARTGVRATIACPSNGHRRRGLSGRNVVARSGERQYAKRGAVAGLAFTAPPDTAIVGVRAGYYFYRADASWQAMLSNGLQVIKGCHRGQSACEVVASNRFLATPPSPALFVDVHCNAQRCPTSTGDRSRGVCSPLCQPSVHSDPPTPLIAGFVLSSTETTAEYSVASSCSELTVDSSDNSGISTVRLLRGDRELAADRRNCDFTFASPCPQSASSFNVDTSAIEPDGPHTLVVETRDAAGNVEQVPRQV